MAKIKPFKAIRPSREKVSLVASRSYITYSKQSLEDKLTNNPYTFLHIINPDFNANIQLSGIDKFKLIKAKFNSFIEQGIFKKDQQEHFYIYQKIKDDGNEFIGIIGAASVEDYKNKTIKIHEQTIKKRERLFRDYLSVIGFNAEPVLLAYPNHPVIDKILQNITLQRPEYEYTTTDRDTHRLWLVKNDTDVEDIIKSFEEVKRIYIADGHHRFASSTLLYDKHKSHSNKAHCMSYLIGENQIRFLNFNRLVKDLNHLKPHEFISEVRKRYKVEPVKSSYQPTKQNEISMYCDGQWYSLILKDNHINKTDCVEKLDPAILNNTILTPILNITNLRTDKRIAFVEGSVSLQSIQEKIDENEFAVAFILKPINFKQVMAVADENKTMPPKSTFIQPKLRSGMLIYDLEN